MAHKIDNSKGFNAFVSFAAPAWHGLGTVLNNPVSTANALEQGGLNYDVLKLPNIHYLPNGEKQIKSLISRIKSNKVKDRKAAIAKVEHLRKKLAWYKFLAK